uniref:Pco085448 n=1 Tax=Arundo donax TaxID=35708 RepID=A0A0A9E2M9_ARUDO
MLLDNQPWRPILYVLPYPCQLIYQYKHGRCHQHDLELESSLLL